MPFIRREWKPFQQLAASIQSERGPVGLMIFRFDTGTEASSTVAFIVSLSGFEASAK